MKIPLTIMLALLTTAAAAQDLVVSGRVEAITLIPFGAPTCAAISGAHRGADGRETIVISNACGCEESKLRVEHVYQGKGVREGELLTLRNNLGEWCRPALPLNHEPVLVQRAESDGQWHVLKDGVPLPAAHHE